MPALALVLLFQLNEGELPADLKIRLERTTCFGTCPAYSIEIDSTGAVRYEGTTFVRIEGRQEWRISRDAVVALLDRFERARFFDLKDEYTAAVTDLPTTIVSLTARGRSKTIRDYVGAPEALKQLEAEIDRVAQTRSRVFIDAATARQLAAAGEPIQAPDGVSYLSNAARENDLALLDVLLTANPGSDDVRRALLAARSAEAIDRLVRAGADPNADLPMGLTVLMYHASWGTAQTVEALLRHGARANAYTSEGRTALMMAACEGAADRVAALLKGGADAAARDAQGHTAFQIVERCEREHKEISRRSSDLFPQPAKDFAAVRALLTTR